jgi:hypothetical protein
VDRNDRIATLAALALVAGMAGFVIAEKDFAGEGACYYFSDAPLPVSEKRMRQAAPRVDIARGQLSTQVGNGPMSRTDTCAIDALAVRRGG